MSNNAASSSSSPTSPPSSPQTAAGGHLTLDAEALYRELLRGVRSMRGENHNDNTNTYLAGVASGGMWLAQRLQKDLGLAGEAGVLSSSLHRDDFASRGLASSTSSLLPFDVNGADILLLDDVLYTGRTVRAVINELYDYGRPARVRLAVLVDRGGRELPIEAAYAAARIALPANQSLSLARAEGSGAFSFEVKEA
ncbi:bifunctional pyr operon transcriptional regulator/uracil phosphoribosyltransferase PyrR [Diaphorobacter aerolatus]|uniref:Bifunctional pyr operon transcriptional regulator/uracil phosphoribosyltransferase PyrR n=1 Tax=Diaphorobacter aerolatus TaxID=1288495 RepID=A0A7H0GHN3_9BURK|nr:bifunctional pyr operon transcriptional regulator/uracil phosphoribosyltransferase PyrR [Diaphorobacter aerolatus]QNP47799.1 bifunctional pyr operon transcriptional regulator/uracil phosphoribosyltransferase PyrR [Diaphorobacter aerolatus]